MDPFVHLHTHTEYSVLDGAAKLDDLVRAAVEDGQPAISSTDHGNMYGSLEFYKKCGKAGLKYIPGEEIYMAAESRDERPKRSKAKIDDTGGDTLEGNKLYYHLTVLAETLEGYHNLIRLSSKAFMEGYYYKPRADWEMLEEFHQGLIATSGCLGGLVLQALLRGDEADARVKAGRLQDIFGRDNFFIEIQNHGLMEQIKTNPMLIDLAKYLHAPVVATNDSHYVHRHNALAHDALLCVQTGALIAEKDRFKFDGEEHYLKSSAEMRHLFSEIPEACDNTLWIAERSNVKLDLSGYKLPTFQVPAPFKDVDAYLRALTLGGAKKRYNAQLPQDVRARIDFELDVIKTMGFSSYFLILWDLVKHAHENNIATGPGRGSAAGSVVSYCLGITKIDPIKYDLLFERFLNPSRISMPDIDLDMDSRYRDHMINYTAEKYGYDHVAQIITFNQIKARAAVRDAARVLGYNYMVGDRIAKAMPPLMMGRDTPLSACLDLTPKHAQGYAAAVDVRKMYNNDPEAKAVIDVALGLEGLRRSDGIHAAAVVISDKPITEYCPIQRKTTVSGVPGPVVTQYEMNNVEELGLLKMDFLALKNLDIMAVACDLIKEGRGEDVDIDNLPLDDAKTFDLLQAGETLAVFQLESPQMRELLKSLAPSSFHDIGAVVALYRPGPMASNMHNDYADRKNGRQMVNYFHEDAREVLNTTYGLMIYQEQMMRIAQKFAGYSLAEADNLRKACGKKIREMMAKEKDKLIAGIITQGYEEDLAHYIWDMIEPFADYSFNKSHAYGYGMIAYQTAYLKANYTLEYMAAVLTCADKPERVALQLGECKRLGIAVSPPDVNKSYSVFRPILEENRILFDINKIKNVAGDTGDLIIEERELREFADFNDFVDRMTAKNVNKKTIEFLIKGGAFDSYGHSRKSLVEGLAKVQESARKKIKNENKGVMSLFDIPPVLIPDVGEYDPKEKMMLEKEALGVYLTDHPLNRVAELFEDQNITPMMDVPETYGNVAVIGLISNLKVFKTKKGDDMCTFTLEDLQADGPVLVFPQQMKKFGHLLKDDAIIKIFGQVNHENKVVAQEVISVDTTDEVVL